MPRTVIKTNISKFKENCCIKLEFFFVFNNIRLTKENSQKIRAFVAFKSKLIAFGISE
jgi:hypothetical protein